MLNSKWKISYVLPNIKLNRPFETDFMAIVPYSDTRIKEIMTLSKESTKLLNGFIDDLNNKIEPAVMLLLDTAPNKVWSTEAMISFRNSVAIAIILIGWANTHPSGNIVSPLFSDFFDFYPITFNRNGSLVTVTPASAVYRSPSSPFIGMSSLILPKLNLLPYPVDKIILNSLLKIWKRRFVSPGKDDLKSRRIFRSIEMAYHALSVPIKNEATQYDYGVNISLWVSAFEILAHPKNTDVNQTEVMSLLANYPINRKSLKILKYRLKIGKHKASANLIQRIYKYLYDTRNVFLHGNNATSRILHPQGNKNLPSLWALAPIIYRMALFSYLVKNKYIKFRKNYDNLELYHTQNQYEDFLLGTIKKIKKHRSN